MVNFCPYFVNVHIMKEKLLHEMKEKKMKILYSMHINSMRTLLNGEILMKL